MSVPKLITAFTALLALPLAVPATAQAPSVAQGQAVDGRALAGRLADALESDYVYPEIGRRYAAMLRGNAGAGRYDLADPAALADRMTADLKTVHADGHIRVIHEPPGGTAQVGPGRRPSPVPNMEGGGWIAPGIAFVRFNLFPGDEADMAAAESFMKAHAGARVLIFDIRTHRGGGMAEMDAIFPWLFDAPTRLVAMATRKSVDEAGGSPIDGIPSMRRIEADPAFVTREHWATPGSDPRLKKAKVYVLTSPRTGSAAEHFALAMKATGRGTLVGSATAGANHFGSGLDLGGGMSAFVPVGRTYDPKTGKDWEGVGVLPDIETAPEDALRRVLELEGLDAAEAARLSAERMPSQPMVRRKPVG